MAKFDEFVNLQFGSADSGAASGLMNLSRQFEGYRQQAFEYGKRKVIEEQTREGQESFQKGEKPEFKEEGFIGGVSAKAYNAGLKSAYLAGLSNDLSESFANFQRENPSDSNAYSAAVAAERAALEQEVDPSVLPDVLETFDRAATTGLNRVRDAEFKAERSSQIQSVSDGVNGISDEAIRQARLGNIDLAAEGLRNVKGLLDGAVEAEIISQDDASDIFAQTQREAIESENRHNFESLADSQGFEAAYSELDRIAGKPPKGWSVDEWQKYVKSQQAELTAKERRQAKEAKIDKAAAEKAKDFADIESRLGGDERIVMNEKRVDEYYQERVVPLVQGLEPEARDAAIANFVNLTKVVPSGLKDQTTSFIRSGNPELIAEASSLINRLDEVPGVSDDLASPNERAFAEKVTDLMANMDAKEAVRIAQQATDPRDKARIDSVNDELKKQFTGTLKTSQRAWSKEQANDAFSKFWGSDPEADPINADQMGKEWNDNYVAFRQAGMDEAKAINAANGAIKRNWSEFNGEILKYAPDVYYGAPDDDNEYITEQLVSDINADSPFPVSQDNIILISDERTSRTASAGQPDYAIAVIQPDGGLFRYPATGARAFRWKPDREAELERRAEENATAAMERRNANMSKKEERQAFKALENVRGF